MTDNIETYALGEKINGETYGHWTAEWWKHMISSNPTGSGGIFKFQQDGVWFLASEFVNKRSTPKIEGKMDVGGLVLCPCDNQFIFSSEDKNEELQNACNLFVNSAEKLVATIEKQDENIIRFYPVRVYTSVRGLKYTMNLSRKVESGENLFYSIDKGDGDFEEGQDIHAFADGHWIFFKIKEPGVYKIETYAQMRDFSNIQEIFSPQAHYILHVR